MSEEKLFTLQWYLIITEYKANRILEVLMHGFVIICLPHINMDLPPDSLFANIDYIFSCAVCFYVNHSIECTQAQKVRMVQTTNYWSPIKHVHMFCKSYISFPVPSSHYRKAQHSDSLKLV
jgi:hypothetical protein